MGNDPLLMQALKPGMSSAGTKKSSVAGYVQRQTEKAFLVKILAFILELYFRFVEWGVSKIKIKLFRCAESLVFGMPHYSHYI